jgi:hypothetical protein
MKKSDGTKTKKTKANGIGKQRKLERNTLKSSYKHRCSHPKCILKQYYEKPTDETQWPDTKHYHFKPCRSLVCGCSTDGKDNKIQFYDPVKKKWLQHSAFYPKTPRRQNTTVTVVQNNEEEEDTEDETMDSADFSQNHFQQMSSVMDVQYWVFQKGMYSLIGGKLAKASSATEKTQKYWVFRKSMFSLIGGKLAKASSARKNSKIN